MLYNIKKYILENRNRKINLRVNNIRNKSEDINGIIIEIYERFFVIKSDKNINRSFNYSDILTGNIEILK